MSSTQTAQETGEYTLGIIKPDAVMAHVDLQIIKRIKEAGFLICMTRTFRMTRAQAENLYATHRAQSYFPQLINFMTSGPSIVLVLKKANAVRDWLALMGASDPSKAAAGTLRHDYGDKETPGKNAVHGSISDQSALGEMKQFFDANLLESLMRSGRR